ncbi:MAG TPA: 23S rRNA (uracil(1939)-C(5))-methyltransferase RlmD [Candidatus Dorea intestinavium]|nr:23S rRNA (uracil(1939)-C(5))-methyltransferase RlmD [Candidatus Dorea intestinavium]
MKNILPVHRGKQIELTINGLGSSGEGVGRYQDFTIFARGALPKEVVKVEIETVKKNYAQGKMVAILKGSKERKDAICPVYDKCGGCQLQHLDYGAQIKAKTLQVKETLTRIGHLKDINVLPTLKAAEPFYYRNKMQFPVSARKGRVEIGCYAAASHDVVDVEHCYIQKTINNDIVAVVRKWMKEYKIAPYDEDRGSGLVRHVMGRVGAKTGEVMVVLVTTTYDIPHIKELISDLRKTIPNLKSVIQNINKRHTNVILGTKERVLFGKAAINDKIGDLSFKISAQSFFQVNTEQAEVLYNKAIEFASLTGKETVFDIYCGTGTISLFLAKQAKAVYGIEIVPSAILDARKNAEYNKRANVTFMLGDAAQKLPELLHMGVKPEVVVIDPPRAGCEERVLKAIAGVKPKRIVYVSCNPSTLARDLALLEKEGYKTSKVQPVDMFPQTYHVETVVLMSRVDK